MNKCIVAFATVVSALSLFPAFAVSSESPVAEKPVELEKEASVELPKIEAGVYYSTMKIERGMVENDESVFGYGVEIEWYGVFGGVETCYDMTGVNGRQWRYNEIESFLGYGITYKDITARAAYVYKACGGDESDTQEVEFEVEYENEWVTPFAVFQIDTMDNPGAFYGACGLTRTWKFTDWLALVTDAEIGFGNARRNESDFERSAAAAREIRLGTALEIELCPHLKIVPRIDCYDYFTAAQRAAYDKFNGFVAAAGCQLVLEF